MDRLYGSVAFDGRGFHMLPPSLLGHVDSTFSFYTPASYLVAIYARFVSLLLLPCTRSVYRVFLSVETAVGETSSTFP